MKSVESAKTNKGETALLEKSKESTGSQVCYNGGEEEERVQMLENKEAKRKKFGEKKP